MNDKLKQIFIDSCGGDKSKEEMLPIFMAGALSAICLVETGGEN